MDQSMTFGGLGKRTEPCRRIGYHDVVIPDIDNVKGMRDGFKYVVEKPVSLATRSRENFLLVLAFLIFLPIGTGAAFFLRGMGPPKSVEPVGRLSRLAGKFAVYFFSSFLH